jgi:ubiquinol-cytochrome c reductase iron-sulfur subunit
VRQRAREELERRERERRAERIVALAFVVSMLSGASLLVLYVLGGQPQLEGILLLLCLGGLGIGIVVWSHDLMPVPLQEEGRLPLASPVSQRELLGEVLREEAGFSRRKLLVRLLVGALAGLGAAAAIPVLSLGPAPGRSLFTTPWRSGARLVKLDGQPAHRDELEVGSILTVFPEGAPGSPDGQTVLIRVEPGALRLPPDRAAWAPDGFVAYSKICTHAGCPVGLFRAETHELICPCHQSTFDVLEGARPLFGPAARPLPQLPIQLQPDGTFVALGDYPEPVGPSFWDMSRKP